MLFHFLLERLKKEGYEFDYIGPNNAEVYAVHMYPVPLPTTECEVVYVSASETFDGDIGTGSPCIILVNEHESDRVLREVQRLLIADIQRKDALVKLQKDISDECEISGLVRHCRKIMQNPVLFVNHWLNIICQSPETIQGGDYSSYIADRVEEWRNSKVDIRGDRRPRYRIQHIFYKGQGYYICVMEKDTDFDDVCDMDFLQRICSLFDAGMGKHKRGNKTQEEKNASIRMIIIGLLLKRFQYPEKEIKKLELLGWEPCEKYTVLTVENKRMTGVDRICQELSDILDTDIYNLGKYYVAILRSKKHVEYTEQDFPQLEKYLKKNELAGILSMGFFDIQFCAVRFEQCRDCLEVAYNGDNWSLRYYGRYQMTHFIKVLNKNYQLDLKSFCSPVILQIYETDKKQNTDYLTTLYTYICSGQAMKYSADAMGIHVNTMYMRVSKLKDEFKIDFDDAHMLYTLHNSIVFLFLCDNTCLKVAYPCLKQD